MDTTQLAGSLYLFAVAGGAAILLAALFYASLQRRKVRQTTGEALPGEDLPANRGAHRGTGAPLNAPAPAQQIGNSRGWYWMIGAAALVFIVALVAALIPTTARIDVDHPTQITPTPRSEPAQSTDPVTPGNAPVR